MPDPNIERLVAKYKVNLADMEDYSLGWEVENYKIREWVIDMLLVRLRKELETLENEDLTKRLTTAEREKLIDALVILQRDWHTEATARVEEVTHA